MGFKIISPYLLNKFLYFLCRPPVGRDLRVRRSIPVLFSFSRSYNGHRRVPPFHLFSVSLVSRLRVPSIIEALFIASPRVFPRFGVLGYSFLGFRLIMGRNHRFLYPPFFYFLPYPYGPCQHSLFCWLCSICSSVCPLFCKIETFFVCFFLFVPLL